MIYGFDDNRQKHEVVGADLPHIIETYDDGNGGGYRLYSDGWCEQWGVITNSSAAYNTSVAFYIPFTTKVVAMTAYPLVNVGAYNNAWGTYGVPTLTNGLIGIYAINNNGSVAHANTASKLMAWFACGY